MTCQKKNKKLLVYCLLLLLFLVAVTPLLYSVNSYASETDNMSASEYFRTHNFYDTCAYVCRKYASFPYYDYLTGSSSGITYDAFADYLEAQGKTDLLQDTVIVNESSGGRGYDLSQDLRQEMVNFVQNNYVSQNPLSFQEAYIYSYNFLNPDTFSNYNFYKATQDFIKQADGICICQGSVVGSRMRSVIISVIPRSANYAFIGSVNNGAFSNVTLARNWDNSSASVSGLSHWIVQENGTVETFTGNSSWVANVNNGATVTNTAINTLFTNYDKNELVYVFPTINAYKHYNSSSGQAYYMPSNSQVTVPYYDGFTDKDLATAGNFYNNIVINTSGDNPNEIRKKTDSILGSLDSVFSSDDSSDNGGGLLGGLTDIITGATGAISPIKEIVLGDIKALIEDTFSWLPPTIITIWIAGITFGVFFGVLKLIRG